MSNKFKSHKKLIKTERNIKPDNNLSFSMELKTQEFKNYVHNQMVNENNEIKSKIKKNNEKLSDLKEGYDRIIG